MSLNTDGPKKTTIYILSLLAVLLFVAGYYPLLSVLVQKWANSEEYTHAFLTFPIILFMVWQKRTVLLQTPASFSFLGLLLVILSTVFYLFALKTNIFTLIAISMITTVLGVIIYLSGIKGISELFTPLVLLVLLIPAPTQLYAKVTFPLQLKVSQASEWIVRLFGVPLHREGNIMNIPEKSFEVVEACSGLRSMITIFTLSILIGYFLLRKNSSKLMLLTASIPTAIVTNIIRVSAMILLFYYLQFDLSTDTWHTALGVAVFCIALLILFLLQRALEIWDERVK